MDRLLIIGCGDIARRAMPHLAGRYDIAALVRKPDRALGGTGATLIEGDLDRPETLARLCGVADCVLHAAPPAAEGETDVRTRNLIAALSGAAEGGAMVAQRLRRFVYLSTSGVYGDCGGERVDESREPRPATARARRRLDAENVLRDWCGRSGVALVILRVPGIYAADRLPTERLRTGVPALLPADDVYTSHVHADDLAAMVVNALERRDVEGTFNANDDTEMKAGDWLDLVADRQGLARPVRVPRAEAARRLGAERFSFLSESRRLVNCRIKEALGVRLRYPTVYEGVPFAAGT